VSRKTPSTRQPTSSTKSKSPRLKRGAQPGNTNTRKHGGYSYAPLASVAKRGELEGVFPPSPPSKTSSPNCKPNSTPSPTTSIISPTPANPIPRSSPPSISFARTPPPSGAYSKPAKNLAVKMRPGRGHQRRPR
jgi:hypothetical protein